MFGNTRVLTNALWKTGFQNMFEYLHTFFNAKKMFSFCLQLKNVLQDYEKYLIHQRKSTYDFIDKKINMEYQI